VAGDVQDDDAIVETRDNPEAEGVLSYTYKSTDPRRPLAIDVSLDISGSSTSVKPDTIAGIYTFSNQSTFDNVTIAEIKQDLLQLANPRNRRLNVQKHTLSIARAIFHEGENLLDQHLLCKDLETSNVNRNNDRLHNELRHLLMYMRPQPPDGGNQFKVALVAGAATSTVAGFVTGYMKFMSESRGAQPRNETSNWTRIYSPILQGIDTGSTSALVTFLTSIVAAFITSIGNVPVRGAGGQDLAAHAFLANVRWELDDLRRRINQLEAERENNTASPRSSSSSSSATSSSSSSSPAPSPTPSPRPCVSRDDAWRASRALGRRDQCQVRLGRIIVGDGVC
ncbi:MAG: hypothetical protein Q9183_003651, partial [Haloplaca sp. 2 TL-2023]